MHATRVLLQSSLTPMSMHLFQQSFDMIQNSNQSIQGILGVVKAYYGCIKAQGCGSLHNHMVIWFHGGLTSDEIQNWAMTDPTWKGCLVDFLDDTVCNIIPADPDPIMSVQSCKHHSCAVRGIDPAMNPTSEDTLKAWLKDLHNVILQSQCYSSITMSFTHKYTLQTSQVRSSKKLSFQFG